MNTSHAPRLSRSRALTLPLVLLMSLGVSLVSPVSAAVPIAPPTGGVPGGLFSQNFSNIASTPTCGVGSVITGFDATPGIGYLKPTCLNVPDLIRSVLASSNIDALIRVYLGTNVPTIPGQVLTGFDPMTGSGQYIAMSSSQWVDGLSGGIYYSGGNVGIGTDTPDRLLHVVGHNPINDGYQGQIVMENATPTGNAAINIRVNGPNSTAIQMSQGSWPTTLTGGAMRYIMSGVNTGFQFGIKNVGNVMVLRSSGNVGIGTDTPTAKLEVAGALKIVDGSQGTGKVLTSDASGLASWQIASGGAGGTICPGTGGGNTCYGSGALQSNTIGYYNTANGSTALYSNTSGLSNTANGFSALYSNFMGSQNTANGHAALYHNTSGSNNIASGFAALFSNTMGYYNTANGSTALYSNTTGINNTANGYAAGSNITTGSGNIAIGYNSQVASPTASDQLSIGNWIYGTSGNIGIGTSTPTAKLEVIGNIIADNPILPNHVATRAYVDAAIVNAGDEMANCIPASQALMNAKGTPKTLCYKSSTEFSCFYASWRQKTNGSGYTSDQGVYYDFVNFPNTYAPYFSRTMIVCSDGNRLTTAPKNYSCRQHTTYGPGGPADENQVLPLTSYCMIY